MHLNKSIALVLLISFVCPLSSVAEGELPLNPAGPISPADAAAYRDKVLFSQWDKDFNRYKNASDSKAIIQEIRGSVKQEMKEGDTYAVRSAIARPVKNGADTTIRIMSSKTGAAGKAVGTVYGITQGAIESAKSGGQGPCKSSGECFEKALYGGIKGAVKQYGGKAAPYLIETESAGKTTAALIQDNSAYSQGMTILNRNMTTLGKMESSTQSTMDKAFANMHSLNNQVQAFDSLNNNPYQKIEQNSNTIESLIQERQRLEVMKAEQERLQEIARIEQERERQRVEAESRRLEAEAAREAEAQREQAITERNNGFFSTMSTVLTGVSQGINTYYGSGISRSSYASDLAQRRAAFEALQAAQLARKQQNLARIRTYFGQK